MSELMNHARALTMLTTYVAALNELLTSIDKEFCLHVALILAMC